jgi:hypothetical protein
MAWIRHRFWRAHIGFVVCALGIVLAGNGCMILDKCTAVLPMDSYEPVDLIEMPFQPFVYHIDDTINPGKMVPCLKGRVYLMHRLEVVNGETLARPVVARGKLIAQVFDITGQTQGVTPRMITEWKLEPKALRLVQSSDQIGVGYTLFLPFEEYTPAIKNVMLRIIYEDEKGQQCKEDNRIALRMAEDSPQLNMTKSFNVPATLLPRR